MDKPRIFLGSSGKQEKLLQALTRGLEGLAHVEPWTMSILDGRDGRQRAKLIAERLRHWKSITNA